MPKEKPQELPNMPEPEGLGLAAQNFRTAIEKCDAAAEEKGEAMQALYRALVKSKRTSISIDGFVFERFHQGPRDTIKVKKPK